MSYESNIYRHPYHKIAAFWLEIADLGFKYY